MAFFVEAEVMDEQGFCKDCRQHGDCAAVYEKLGGIGGPSVLRGVFCAFLLPMLTFIVVLALFEIFVDVGRWAEVIGALAGFCGAFVCVLIVLLVGKRPWFGRRAKSCGHED